MLPRTTTQGGRRRCWQPLPRAQALALAVLAAACGRSTERPAAAAEDEVAVASSPTAAPKPAPACGDELESTELEPGLRLERIRAWIDPPIPLGDRCMLLLRADPRRFPPRLLTAVDHGGSRPAPRWAADFDLAGVINASMFTETMRSTGLMVDGERVNNPAVNESFGAFFAFDPVAAERAPAALFGRGCPGFDLDAVRRDYRVVVQNYRLLDCDGSGIAWKDPKIHSAAAIAIDRDGNVVFILLRTPYQMEALSRMLAAPALNLAAAMYVEGGPEASLFVKAGAVELTAIGSYETLFLETDENARAWDLPNVIGLSR